MLNLRLPDIEMYEDVMTHNSARIASRILPRSRVLRLIQKASRDSARTPMQWTDGENAGFTTGKPWFFVNDNYKSINVQAQEEDPDSLLNFYRALLQFRREQSVALWGDYREHLPDDRHLYVYERNYEGKKLLVICAFGKEAVRFEAPEGIDLNKGSLVLSNYDLNFIIANGFTTRPYELRVYLFE